MGERIVEIDAQRPLRRDMGSTCYLGVCGGRGSALSGVAQGICRAVVFIREVLPILLHYKKVQRKTRKASEDRTSAAYDELHVRYAPRALAICKKMQGFYVKLGQMAAGGGCGIMPQVYLDVLGVLLEDAPSLTAPEVRHILEQELGPMHRHFSSFDEDPLHGASIGQVHRATLQSGQEVVVKVQYPHAERNFHVDISCFLLAARVLAPEHVGLLEEIQKHFVNEFDYRSESRLQAEAVKHVQGLAQVVVPSPMQHLCTKHILVMERLTGMSLGVWGTQVLTAMGVEPAMLSKLTAKDIEELQPSYWTLLFNDVLQWMFGSCWASAPSPSLQPLRIDTGHIATVLMQAQAHMIFEAGFFNGDPHPGNLMVLDDGRLGLIDWGQVKRLGVIERCRLARLVLAVAARDERSTATFMRDLGMRTTNDWDWTYAKLAQYYLCSWSEEFVQELGGVLQFEGSLRKVDPVLHSVGEYHMVFRNQIFTRQALAMLGLPRASSATFLEQPAMKCLHEHGEPIPKISFSTVAVPAEVHKLASSF